MPSKHIRQIDGQTGEELQGTIVFVGAKHPSIYGADWFMPNREAHTALSMEPELRARTFRVLHFLLGRLDFENWIQVQQKEIAEKLGIHPTSVSKEVNLLIKKKILLKGPKIGNTSPLRLNPYYGWRGNSKKGREWIQEIIQGGKAGKVEDTPTK